MYLTDKKKKQIDSLSYQEMLQKWRFAPIGDPLFEGETGDYFSARMKELAVDVDEVAVSKKVGWDK